MVNFDIEPYRALYPFASRTLELAQGVRYHYLDEGEGEPLLFVHGNPTWSFTFRGLIVGLRGSYRCIAPDHVGCGLSEKPGDDRYEYRLARRVDDLEALAAHLGLGRGLTLVVHDWGGAIGCGFAARHPDAIARLVILNTSAFGLPPGKRFPWPLWLTRTPLGALLVRGGNAFSLAASYLCATGGLPREVRRAYRAPYDSWANRIATLRFVQDIPLRPGDASYAALAEAEAGLPALRDRPALICWGERDFVFDRAFLARWREHLPGAEVHAFPDAGHLVHEDRAAEVLALARGFLARHPLEGRNAGAAAVDREENE